MKGKKNIEIILSEEEYNYLKALKTKLGYKSWRMMLHSAK